MKPTSLETPFLPPSDKARDLKTRVARRGRTASELLKALETEDFTAIYDVLRLMARDSMDRNEAERALATLSELEVHVAELPEAETGFMLDLRAALMQIITALTIETQGPGKGAATSAAATLQLLARQPRRKDAPFLEVLGALLFDIAYIHAQNGEYRQAEREMEKSIKIYERLAKTVPDRYASTVVTALSAATNVYHNRQKQAELLARYQEATTAYTEMVSAGMTEATDRLAESLTAEGDTLARMGRHREAIQYYTRALRYLQRLNPELDERQIRVSVSLAESMLRIGAMRDKAIHLLNTMLHKALRINSPALHQRISELLASSRSEGLAILGLWHKIFPR